MHFPGGLRAGNAGKNVFPVAMQESGCPCQKEIRENLIPPETAFPETGRIPANLPSKKRSSKKWAARYVKDRENHFI